MLKTGDTNLLHAKVHREIIRQFGRFPYHNVALDSQSTHLERDYFESGGYGFTLWQLKKAPK